MNKNENIGCALFLLSVNMLLVIPSVLYGAFVLQKLSLWYFDYTNSLYVFVGISLIVSMLTRDGDPDNKQKEDESLGEYMIRVTISGLLSLIVKPTTFLFFGWIFQRLFS